MSDCFSQNYPRLSGEEAFLHYEHVRQRLPNAQFENESLRAENLLEIADHFDVFVFDAYGVLNIGNTPISSSPACIEQLRKMGKSVFVLSNGASYAAEASVAKFEGLGFDFSAEEIVSSRIAAERALADHGDSIVWGAMAKADYSSEEIPQPTVKLADDPAVYDDVTGFLFLSTLDWNESRQQLLDASFKKNPRPIMVANPDIVSPREDHFGMEPGYVAHRLIEKYAAEVEFYGKPFLDVFDIVDERLDKYIDKNKICMIGDTLHTDILGGAAHGWRTILVADHGMFKGLDAERYVERSGIVPDYIVPSI